METKQNTLRSRTVRCAHCGEYYSVTYKYCPFCDAARQEQEEKRAAKKKSKSSLFGGLFGSSESESSKKSSGTRKSGEGHKSSSSKEEHSKSSHEGRSARSHDEKAARTHSSTTAAKKKSGPRKKTSEMTPEERAAALADREARAAQRKRERERAAREAEAAAQAAALAAAAQAAEKAREEEAVTIPVQPTPVYEDPTVPEAFGLTADTGDAPIPEAAPAEEPPAAPAQPEEPEAPEATKVPEATQEEMETIPIFVPSQTTQVTVAPEGATPEELVQSVAPSAPAEPEEDPRWSFVKDLEAAAGISPQGDSPIPTVQAPQAPEEPQPVEEPVQKAQAASQEAAAAGADDQAQPAAEAPAGDLDALLSEIRDMLADSPVPAIPASQLRKPAQEVVSVEVPQETPAAQEPQETPAQEQAEAPAETPQEPSEPAAPVQEAQPVQEPAPEVTPEPVAEPEPDVSPAPQAEPEEAASAQEEPAAEEPAPEEEAAQEAPEQQAEAIDTDDVGFPVYEPISEELKEEAAEVQAEPEVLPVTHVNREKKTAPAKEPKSDKKKRKKKNRGSLIPLVISLIIVVAAVVIITKTVVPAFQTGVFSGQSDTQEDQTGEETQDVVIDTAESVALKETELSLDEEGATATLTPVFTPEDGTAALTWSSSDTEVATVDENGVVTSVGHGTATITAAMENGQTATCEVTSTWGEAAPVTPTLNQTEVTLDGSGKTYQLQVDNASGSVKWSSSKNSVATVESDGTVTAVGKGSAVITAEVDDQVLECEVRCVW